VAPVARVELPPRLVRAQQGAADAWLAGLPALAAELLARWQLTLERVAAPGGRGSLVLLVRDAAGEPAALKLCPPGPAVAWEYAALRRWDGRGAVRALRWSEPDGALLLERVHGEISLRSLAEPKAFEEAASAVHRLWVAPGAGHGFRTVAEHTGRRARALREALVPEVRPLVDEALELRRELTADAAAGGAAAECWLLHGDFRQGAVLASGEDRSPWLAVGPEPLVGERAYDLARLVRDRLHDLVASPGAAAVTRRRLARLADSLEVDRERLRSWTRFRAVDSGVRQLTHGLRADGELLLEFAGWL
jgi:streptomycin 6-kinase